MQVIFVFRHITLRDLDGITDASLVYIARLEKLLDVRGCVKISHHDIKGIVEKIGNNLTFLTMVAIDAVSISL